MNGATKDVIVAAHVVIISKVSLRLLMFNHYLDKVYIQFFQVDLMRREFLQN